MHYILKPPIQWEDYSYTPYGYRAAAHMFWIFRDDPCLHIVNQDNLDIIHLPDCLRGQGGVAAARACFLATKDKVLVQYGSGMISARLPHSGDASWSVHDRNSSRSWALDPPQRRITAGPTPETLAQHCSCAGYISVRGCLAGVPLIPPLPGCFFLGQSTANNQTAPSTTLVQSEQPGEESVRRGHCWNPRWSGSQITARQQGQVTHLSGAWSDVTCRAGHAPLPDKV